MVIINLLGEVIPNHDVKVFCDMTDVRNVTWYNYSTDCPICTKPNVGSTTTCYRCNQIFHDDCLGNWLKIKKSCPMCRANMNKCTLCGIRGHTKRTCRVREIHEDPDYDEVTMSNTYLRWDA